MNKIKLLTKLMLGISLALMLAGSAVADTESYFQTGQVHSSPPGTDNFTFSITPFDSSLGTLNSVTVYAEVNVSGSAQLWSSDEFAELSVEFVNSLGELTEMGWDSTEAKFEATEPLWYYDYDFSEGYVQVTGSGNQYNFGTIVTDFGRFAGTETFEIGLELSGSASSSGATGYDLLVSSYDGNATLSYEYDYTPAAIPEPTTIMLVGFGLAGLAGVVRKFRK